MAGDRIVIDFDDEDERLRDADPTRPVSGAPGSAPYPSAADAPTLIRPIVPPSGSGPSAAPPYGAPLNAPPYGAPLNAPPYGAPLNAPPYAPVPAGAVGPPAVRAGVGARLGAWLLDGLIVGVPSAIVYVVVLWLGAAVLFNGISEFDGDQAAGGIGLIVFGLVVVPFLLAIGYWLYVMLLMKRPGARNGQTIGRGVLDIRVARMDGQPVGPGVAFLRDVLYRSGPPLLVLLIAEVIGTSSGGSVAFLLLVLLFDAAWYGAAIVMAATDPYGRTVWDRWAGTLVVTTASTPYGPPMRPFPPAGPSAAPPVARVFAPPPTSVSAPPQGPPLAHEPAGRLWAPEAPSPEAPSPPRPLRLRDDLRDP